MLNGPFSPLSAGAVDTALTGLVVGIDVVDRPTARRLREALVRHGALVGLTGPSGDVLKVRPRLVWDTSHAAMFVDRLERALEDVGDAR